MPQNYGNDKNVKYVNRDFQGLKADLMSYIQTYFPDTFSDFNETSSGMMLLELVAYVGDVLNFYIDEQFKEMMLPTVSERKNLLNISKTFGYRVKPTIPAMCEVEVSCLLPATGDAYNRVPNYSKCIVIDSGMVLESGTTAAKFQTLDVVDFTISGSDIIQEYATDGDGLVNMYKQTRKVLAVAGEEKQSKFVIGQPVPFRRLTLEDDNVSSIISVTDSNDNKYYEVSHLAQDRVFTDSHYLNDARTSAYSDLTGNISGSVAAPFQLDAPHSTKKRFTLETNEDNTTSLIFGNGITRSDVGSQVLEDLYLENQDINALIQNNLPDTLDPLSNINYNSLGETPANTTITVKYRIGGGIKTNVPANDLNSIISKKILANKGETSVVDSINIKNPSPARGGKDGESINEIKENVKSFFSTQNRCVTKEDYEARILALPSKYGSVSKCFVTRYQPGQAEMLAAFDLDEGGTIDAPDVSAFSTMINNIASQGDIDGSSGGTDYTTSINAIANFIGVIPSLGGTIGDTATHKNLDAYVLAQDANRDLAPTNDVTKQSLGRFLDKFKSITDNLTIKDGIVINFGVLFDVVTHKSYNKSEIKLQLIEKIKNYFDIDKMTYNQIIYISDLENILYETEGVKYVNFVKITQIASELGVESDLRAQTGIPFNGVCGIGPNSYGFGYDFAQFSDGVIRPALPNGGAPSIFELKNPNQNIRGVVS
tara:strand:- start:3579 stop:5714 length:2136 start_codon:yes stop_codon:yes gene_type:complete